MPSFADKMRTAPSSILNVRSTSAIKSMCPGAVSYTHLDVYKRQDIDNATYTVGIAFQRGKRPVLLWQSRLKKMSPLARVTVVSILPFSKRNVTIALSIAVLWAVSLPSFLVPGIDIHSFTCLLYTSSHAFVP